MEDSSITYEVMRSRNNGKFWSSITWGINLGFDEAKRILEEQHRQHPSDWLKVEKIERETVLQILGNSKPKGKTTKETSTND